MAHDATERTFGRRTKTQLGDVFFLMSSENLPCRFTRMKPFMVLVFLFSGAIASANCVDVVKPIEYGQCRARPDTKTYLGSPTPEKIWTYSCEYECWVSGSVLEVTKAIHQDYETNEMNSLVCKGVELDIIDNPGSIVRQCRRTVKAFEILAQNSETFTAILSGPRPFRVDASVRARVVRKFASEMKEVASAYSASAAAFGPGTLQRNLLSGVAEDLLMMGVVFDRPVGAAPSAESAAILNRYLPYLKTGGPLAVPGTREGFVTTHLGMHRDLILNLASY